MKSIFLNMAMVSAFIPIAWSMPLSLEPIRPISFINPPRLLSTSTTSNNTSAPATYYFTITLPPDAQELLQKITVKQVDGGQPIRFNLHQTRVYAGKREQLHTMIPSQTAIAQNALTITLVPPLPPGRTFTLAVRPIRNPDAEGTYFLGVTAFPKGNNVESQFLGFGRFQFQRSNGAE